MWVTVGPQGSVLCRTMVHKGARLLMLLASPNYTDSGKRPAAFLCPCKPADAAALQGLPLQQQ